MNKLKACPFCGRPVVDNNDNTVLHPHDHQCPLTGMVIHKTKWNARAIDETALNLTKFIAGLGGDVILDGALAILWNQALATGEKIKDHDPDEKIDEAKKAILAMIAGKMKGKNNEKISAST